MIENEIGKCVVDIAVQIGRVTEPGLLERVNEIILLAVLTLAFNLLTVSKLAFNLLAVSKLTVFMLPIIFGLAAISNRVYNFLKDQRRFKRTLRKAPILTVGGFADGTEAKLVGKVRLLAELCSPLTGRPCAHYHVKVEVRHIPSRESGGSWSNFIEEEKTVAFVLDDGTGRAIVEAEDAQISVVEDAHFRSGTFNDATPQLESFLAKHGRKSTGLFGFNKGLRYAEGVIEEGESVTVFGRGAWENDGSGTRRLVISQPRDGQLRVSDNPSTL